jgi:nicotinamide N-methyltransferase
MISLWAHELWNAGKSLANYIDRNPEMVQGKKILEMGAAASLPSIMASFHNAELVYFFQIQ